MMLEFVLVLYAGYPMTMGYRDMQSCMSDLERYSKPPYLIKGNCMPWAQAQRLKLVLSPIS